MYYHSKLECPCKRMNLLPSVKELSAYNFSVQWHLYNAPLRTHINLESTSETEIGCRYMADELVEKVRSKPLNLLSTTKPFRFKSSVAIGQFRTWCTNLQAIAIVHKGGTTPETNEIVTNICSCHNFFSLSSVQIIFIPACCLLCVL